MKKTFLHSIRKWTVVMFSNIIIAFAVSCFYTPNKIVGGGVSGLSNILFHSLNINLSVSMIVTNLIFAVISYKKLGLKFLVPSFINAAIIGVLADVFVAYVPPMTANPLLASVFGGAIYGFGIALCFVNGVSSGGTDILSRFLQAIAPHLKIGKVLLGVDACIIILSLVVFKQADLALYGIIALFISTYSIDWFISKLNVSKLAFVVTSKGEEMSNYLVSTSPRGVTLINAVGAYTKEPKVLLICALKSNEIVNFQRNVLEIDNSSFIIFSESQQIIGNGFRLYR